MRTFFLLVVLTSILSCAYSDKQKEVLVLLNDKYDNYEFSHFHELTGFYIEVEAKEDNTIDSNEVKSIYRFLEKKQDELLDDEDVFWRYLIFYDNNGDYLYTVTRRTTGRGITIYRDAIH